MKSIAFHHFPRVVAGPDRFWLFNPILKKRYENRPEERVRLKWVEYILHQTDWKKSRIGFESPVKLQQRKTALRADLVFYSNSMKPAALVECKSDSVKLNQSAAEQAARYNSEVNAPHLVLTNGIEDYWYEKSKGEIKPSDNFFDEHISTQNLQRDFEYWHLRGFCSSESNSEMSDWLAAALNTFWSDKTPGQRQFLDFQKSVLPVPMNQYYNVFEVDSERRLAVSFLGSKSSNTYILGILNLNGVNQGILAINLDHFHQGDGKAITIFKNGSADSITSKKELSFTFGDFQPNEVRNLPQIIMKFFD